MTTRLKIRSDYHDVLSAHPSAFGGLNRWLKPFLWLAFGVVLGMSYNKKNLQCDQETTVAQGTVKQDLVSNA